MLCNLVISLCLLQGQCAMGIDSLFEIVVPAPAPAASATGDSNAQPRVVDSFREKTVFNSATFVAQVKAEENYKGLDRLTPTKEAEVGRLVSSFPNSTDDTVKDGKRTPVVRLHMKEQKIKALLRGVGVPVDAPNRL